MTGLILFGILLFGCFIFLYLMSQTQVNSISLFQYGKELDVNKGNKEPTQSIFEEKCPERAVYGVMNSIVSYPGSKIFTSLDSYLEYYKYLGSKGLECSFVSPARGDEPVPVTKDSKTIDVVDEQTYAMTPIKKLDDYEFSRVFQVEKEKRNQLERTTVNALTAQRQWDWSQLPFNSEWRAGQEGFMNEKRMEGFTATITEPFYSSISGDDGAPQDTVELDEREQAILHQYAPRKTEDLMNHDKADVEVLVKKLWANDPDWEPILEKRNGIDFEVTGLVPKRKKSDGEFEDEHIPTVAEAIESGLANRKVETTVTPGFDPVQRQDPFFDKGGVIDYDGDRFYKYDNFSKWTPGLERMFAPTFDQNDWVGETQ
jgi:hypothetical protein